MSLRSPASLLVERFGWWCSRAVKSASLPLAIQFCHYLGNLDREKGSREIRSRW